MPDRSSRAWGLPQPHNRATIHMVALDLGEAQRAFRVTLAGSNGLEAA